MGEQSNALRILLRNDRKSRHRRIKKQRRYERLAATSQFLSTGPFSSSDEICATLAFPPEAPTPKGLELVSAHIPLAAFRQGVGCTLRASRRKARTPYQPSRRAAFNQKKPCRLLIIPIQTDYHPAVSNSLHARVLPENAWYRWLQTGLSSNQVCCHDIPTTTVDTVTSRPRESCSTT